MPADDLKLLSDTIAEASAIALRHFGNNPDHWQKDGGKGPVSEADLEINRMLFAVLRQARPEYGWLSEETEDDGERSEHDHVFIVDPIDGTRSFLNRNGNFGISLAVAHKGVVTAAAVNMPVRDLTYRAALGQGATLNATPLSGGGTDQLAGARFLASGALMAPRHWHKRPPPIERHFRSSLAYRLCLVAQGRFDGMMTLRQTFEWDVAAGSLIATEAGINVQTSQGEKPIFNQAKPAMNGLIATNIDLQHQLTPYLKA